MLKDCTIEELVRQCFTSGDVAAWAEFVRRTQPLIASVVIRICRRYGENSDGLADDLVQEAYLKLCSNNYRALREFKHNHPNAFYGLVKKVANSVTYDHVRARLAEKRDMRLEIPTEEGFDPPAADSSKHLEQEVLLQQIDAALRNRPGEQAARERQIFWLHYRQQLTAEDISAIPDFHLSTKGVESVIARLKRYLRDKLGPGSNPQPEGS